MTAQKLVHNVKEHSMKNTVWLLPYGILYSKQITVRPCPGQGQYQDCILDPVDQQPVWLNMTLPVPFPIVGQFVIPIFRRQWFSHRQHFNDSVQTFRLQAAFHCQLIVLFKCSRRFDSQFRFSHFFKSANSSSRSV